MKQRNVSMKDIAKIVGVSVNTVSHALNDRSDISRETKDKIKSTAEQMGYVSNASARYLRVGVSKSVAIIIGDISNPHFSIIVKEIESNLRKKGYTSFVLNTDEDEAIERQAIISAQSKNVDGIIICPTQHSIRNIEYLIGIGIPFTLIGRYFPDHLTNYVVCDDVNGGYAITDYLIKNGHKKILFLNGPKYISSASERLKGYKAALENNNLVFNSKLVHQIFPNAGGMDSKIQSILRSGEHTAILAFSDMIAFEVICTLTKSGFTVPGDFSVAGFDNIQSKLLLPYPLTTVSSSKRTMAAEAAKILLQHMEQEGLRTSGIILETSLIIRDSVRNIK